METSVSIIDFIYEHISIHTSILITNTEIEASSYFGLLSSKDYPCSRINNISDSSRILILTQDELLSTDINKVYDTNFITIWFVQGSSTLINMLPVILHYSSNPSIISLT